MAMRLQHPTSIFQLPKQQGANSGRRLLEDERTVDAVFSMNLFSSGRGSLFGNRASSDLSGTINAPLLFAVGVQAGRRYKER
jgi:hypothetical protein